MSRLPFELLLALRYLRPKRTFVSIITLISILGVALGVAVLIIVISVMSGFDHDLREKILGFNAHLKVFADGGAGKLRAGDEPRRVQQKCARCRAVRAGPGAGGNASRTQWRQPALRPRRMMRGVDPGRESRVSVLPQSIIAGKFDLSGRGLVVGSEFAENLNLSVGDRISIYSPADLKKMKERQRQAE